MQHNKTICSAATKRSSFVPFVLVLHIKNRTHLTGNVLENIMRSLWKTILQGRMPAQVVIQFTDQCNASCRQCGMRRENRFERATLSVDDTKRMLDAMAKQGVAAVSFTGGEPLMYLKPIAECIAHARALGIRYVRTGTNGFIFKGHEKKHFPQQMAEIARTLVDAGVYTCWVSIDSMSPAVHEQNRGLPGMIAGVEKALPIFHEHGLHLSANLGINRYLGGAHPPPAVELAQGEAFYHHFRTGFSQFYQFVEELGFTIVNACYPMSFDEDEQTSVYTATSRDNFIHFTPTEKFHLFRAMLDTVPQYRHRLRIFTPMTSLLSLIRHYGQLESAHSSYACRGGIDFFFIDAKDRNTYPCGFRGTENLGRFEHIDLAKLKQAPWCKQCDWECFRDPSELSGPVFDLLQNPWRLAKTWMRDPVFAKLWWEDVRYYRACGYFDANRPPDMTKLARFSHHAPLVHNIPTQPSFAVSP